VTSHVVWTPDPADPRAPPSDVWATLTEGARARVAASLPSEIGRTSPPEGDPHWLPKVAARKTLERYFARLGRDAYVGSELPIYYPAEAVFAPDVFAVLDVSPHARERWLVDAEGRGLDWVLEIHFSGERREDLERNLQRCARLGVPEYFVFDRKRARLQGWHLAEGARSYVPLVPQAGRLAARTLGLELGLVGERLRFYHADAELPELEELVHRLESAVGALESRVDEAERRAAEEAVHAEQESRRASAERAQRESAEAEVLALRAELASYKK